MKRKTPREILEHYRSTLPSPFSRIIGRFILAFFNLKKPAKYEYSFNPKELKNKQVLLLAAHASFDDALHVLNGLSFKSFNVLMCVKHIPTKGRFKLLLSNGAIPKLLYEEDIKAVRNIMRLKNEGASFLIFPEGIQSMDGTEHSLADTTAKLVKSLDMDVVICTSHGAYLSRPRFSADFRKGQLEYSYKLLPRDDFAGMTEEELNSLLSEKFKYNDFLWNSKMQYEYRGKTACANGLDKILFACPKCHRQFTMKVEGSRLVCSCGNAAEIDSRYNLKPEPGSEIPFSRIDEWFKWQEQIIEEVVSDPSFCLRYDVEYYKLSLDKLRRSPYVCVGEGRIEITRDHFKYVGTSHGKGVELTFDMAGIPSATFREGEANDFFYNGEYHQFRIKKDPRLACKVLLATEAIYRRYYRK